MNRPKVVITGMGLASVLGHTLEEYWEGLIAGKSGIGPISQFDASDLPCQIAGEVNHFDPSELFGRKQARRMPRSAQFALSAAIKAVKHAGLPDKMTEPERSGVYFGTAMGGIDFLDEGIQNLQKDGYRKVSPFIAGGSIPNYSAYLIGKQFQCLGPNSTIATACATSTQAIGEGAEFIRRGVADIVIVGGTESFIRDFGVAGFSAMRTLPTNYNDNPTAASRPFDADREGFVLSEGAAALVLESEQHARSRGAVINAEVAGHSSSSDGYHMAIPNPDASGPVRAMRWALDDADLTIEQVDYINAHGTSTFVNDEIETKAIKILFGEHAHNLAISSTKSMLGHAMGASGALEAIAGVLAIKNNIIPPTINYETPDPACDLDYTPNYARQVETRVVLSNSFGLGGQNACLVLKEYSA